MIDMEQQQVILKQEYDDGAVSDDEQRHIAAQMRDKWGIELAEGERLTDETASTLLSNIGRIARLAAQYRDEQNK